MIYFGPGPEWYEIAAVLVFAVITMVFVVRGIVKSEENKQQK